MTSKPETQTVPNLLKTFPSLHLCNTIIRELKRESVGIASFHEWDSPTNSFLPQFSTDSPIDVVRAHETLNKLKQLHQTLHSNYLGIYTDNTPPNLLWAHDMMSKDTERINSKEVADFLSEYKKNNGLTTPAEVSTHLFEKMLHGECKTVGLHSLLHLMDPDLHNIDKAMARRFLALHRNDTEPYTLKEFEQDVVTWRNRDLLMPLVLAARYMHEASMWHVKPDSPRYAVIQALLDRLNSEEATWKDVTQVCESLPQDPYLAYTVEQLGFIWGARPVPTIEKNFLDFVCTFVSSMGNTFPKAWLCPYLAGYDKPVYGFKDLTWKFNGRSLSLDNSQVQIVHHMANKKRIPYVPYSNALLKVSSLIATDDMYHIIKRPEEVAKFLRGGVVSPALSPRTDPENKLAFLLECRTRASPELTSCGVLMQSIMDEHRKTRTLNLASSFNIVAWNLETPKRVVTFSKSPDLTNHCLSEPHRLRRTICKELSVVRPISRIMVSKEPIEGMRKIVRDALRDHFSNTLSCFQENTNFLHTVLHESVACFTLHEPEHHSIVPLNQTVEWDQAWHDTRYAQTEIDERGGGKYIDRCNFAPSKSKYDGKSKLDAHVIPVKDIYVCNCPYVTSDAPTRWICATSSVPIKSFALWNMKCTDVSDPSIDSELSAFFNSVHTHFKGNSARVPVHPEAEKYQLSKENIEFYNDRLSRSVLMVYNSPKDPRQVLDFTILQLL